MPLQFVMNTGTVWPIETPKCRVCHAEMDLDGDDNNFYMEVNSVHVWIAHTDCHKFLVTPLKPSSASKRTN